jgi:hypothetical protein
VFDSCAFVANQKCCLNVLLVSQLWYSQQAAAGDAPGHPLGFNDYREFGLIEVVAVEEGGGEILPNIGAIAVGGNDAAEGLGDDSVVSRFSGQCS